MSDAAPKGWSGVWAAIGDELRLPPGAGGRVDGRTRTTKQCARLLRDRTVALAVPATPDPGRQGPGRYGPHVVAFTDLGPWLLRAGKGNPALPIEVIGPIADPLPVRFEPHHREGGVLELNGRSFLVPIAYADSVRDFVLALGAAAAAAEGD